MLKLTAPEGYIYTDGEIFGRVIYPAEGENESKYRLISETEYREILSKQEETN